MKYLQSSLVVFLGITLLLSCKKHTVFTGRVTNSADGQPIENVEVTLDLAKYKKGGGAEVLAIDQQKTDTNGQYAVEAEAPDAQLGSLILEDKQGFAPAKRISIDPGDRGQKDFVLHPFDAWLSVTFENQSAIQEKEYFFSYSGSVFYDGPRCISTCGPFKLPPGENRTEVAFIPGGSDMYINWHTIVPAGAITKDTVHCNRNDTTHVKIKI